MESASQMLNNLCTWYIIIR